MDEVLTVAQKSRRLTIAYLNVFGPPDKRSSDQQLVWADIESFCYAHRLCLEGKMDGDVANNYLMNEGRRSVWLRLRGMLVRALMPEPPPPQISRKLKSNPQ